MTYDKRAVKILFDTYWGTGGWKSAAKPGWTPETPPDDLAFATESGLMFPPRRVSHEEALRRLAALRAEILPRKAGTAFVSGLSTNQPALKSALGSLAVALHMPAHPFSAQRNGFSCDICGAYESDGEQDLNQLNFERHKWGGVRHTDPFYIAFDLERFVAEPAPPASKTDEQKPCRPGPGWQISSRRLLRLCRETTHSAEQRSRSWAMQESFGFLNIQGSFGHLLRKLTAKTRLGPKTTGPTRSGGGEEAMGSTRRRSHSGLGPWRCN